MKKEVININKIAKIISNGECGMVCELYDGDIIKIFNEQYMMFNQLCGIDLERKLSDYVKATKEIVKPTSLIYDDKSRLIGYKMPNITGINYNQKDENLTLEQRTDLFYYATLHNKLETIIKNNKDIVFPDLCSCDNIIIDNNSNIHLIDYDGMQIKDHRTLSVSTTVDDACDMLKYYQNGRLTKTLDKRSLIMLYFFTAFNIDLNKVGKKHPITGQLITLDYVFNLINLDNYDLMNEVYKMLSPQKEEDYLGDIVFDIASEYDITILNPQKKESPYMKRLIRK